MIIVFTPTGGPAQTLIDTSAARGNSCLIEQWGGQAVVQTEKRYGQATEIDFPRGNVGGDFVFAAGQTLPGYASVVVLFSQMYALLNAQGTLVVTPTPDPTTVSMPNAVLRDVHKTLLNGLRLELRFTFKITAVTSP